MAHRSILIRFKLYPKKFFYLLINMKQKPLNSRSFGLHAPAVIIGLVLGLFNVSAQTNHSGNPLRFPPKWNGGTLTAAPNKQTLWPGYSTDMLTINGSVPSPTIRVQKGSNFTARIENRLSNDLVMHWHGIIAPPNMDGHPRDAVPPGQSYAVEFPILQRAGTYFYHPHTEPLTGELVYLGMAGAFIVEDPAEAVLGLPNGDHDIPLLLQDKRLRPDRQVVYAPSTMDTMTGFLGDTILVNGTPEAYISVDQTFYRLRLINGSNARVYRLGFSDNRPFQLIANDAGLLSSPLPVTSAFLGPGERIEILVDFATNKVGDSVLLKSMAFDPRTMGGMGVMSHDMMTGTNMMTGATTHMTNTNMMGNGGAMGMGMETSQGLEMDVLRFHIDRVGNGSIRLPTSLLTTTPYNPSQARRTRIFTLDAVGMTHGINGERYNVAREDFQVPFGELEIWEFRNTTSEIHPMHPHGALFQVLDRNGNTNLPPENRGLKDTVLVWPNETVRVLIRFDAYAGLFVMHCHNLEHEDSGMMQNFQVSPIRLGMGHQNNQLSFSFPGQATSYVIEYTDRLGASAQWTPINQAPTSSADGTVITIPTPSGDRFYRLKPTPATGTSSSSDPHAGHH